LIKRRLPVLLLAGALAAADLISKSWIFSWLENQGYGIAERHWIFGRWFAVSRVMNEGVTGGMGSALGPAVLSVITCAAVIGILIYLIVPKSHDRWVLLGLGLILGGAIGNLYDRLRFGAVRDFIDVFPGIDFPWLDHWPTFNLADSGIVVGVGVLLVHSLFAKKRDEAKVAEPVTDRG
jgi:signal peptidase II